MQQPSPLVEEILLKKCPLHPSEVCDTIYLKLTSFSPFTCPHCRSSRNISNKDLLLINDLFESSAEILYPNYPILSNPQTIYDLEQIVEESKRVEQEFEAFFTELKVNVIESIEQARQQQIQKISILSDAYKLALKAYNEAVSIDKFKSAIQNDNLDSQHEEVKEFLKEQYSKAEQNTTNIQLNIDSFNIIIQRFTLSQAKETQHAINHLLQNISLFPERAISKLQYQHDHQLILSPQKQQPSGESLQSNRNEQVQLVQSLQQLLLKSTELGEKQLDAEFNNVLETYLKFHGRIQNEVKSIES